MIGFDIVAIMRDSVISAIALFFIGIYAKRKIGYNVGEFISFIECFFIFAMPILLFWLSHQTPNVTAIFDFVAFLTEYFPSCIVALISLAIGDGVGSIMENTSQSFLY